MFCCKDSFLLAATPHASSWVQSLGRDSRVCSLVGSLSCVKHVPTVLTVVGQRIYTKDWIGLWFPVSFLSLWYPFCLVGTVLIEWSCRVIRHSFGPSTDPDKCMGVDLTMPLPPLVVAMMNYCFFLTFMMNYWYLIGAKGTQYHQLHVVCVFGMCLGDCQLTIVNTKQFVYLLVLLKIWTSCKVFFFLDLFQIIFLCELTKRSEFEGSMHTKVNWSVGCQFLYIF